EDPSKVVTYTYDSYDSATNRRFDTVVTPHDGTTTMYYDVHGNLIEIDSPQGDITYSYDLATGQKTSVTTTNTHITYGYDQEGRLQTVTVHELDGATLSDPLAWIPTAPYRTKDSCR